MVLSIRMNADLLELLLPDSDCYNRSRFEEIERRYRKLVNYTVPSLPAYFRLSIPTHQPPIHVIHPILLFAFLLNN